MQQKKGFFSRFRKQSSIVFNSRFLNKLSHLEAYEFIQLCHRRTYNKDEYIYHQQDPGNGFYIIESGSVELIIEDEPSGDEGDIAPLPNILLESPLSFGNLSLNHELRRMSSARAAEETVVLGFFSTDFDTLEKRFPQIAIKVLGEINSVMAKQIESNITELGKLSSVSEAHRLQFETFYTREDDEPLV